MTREEAELFFLDRGEESYIDYFEEQLFEYKLFFSSKPPIAKTFKAKLQKLNQFSEALSVIQLVEPHSFAKLELPVFTDDIKDTFNLFNSTRNSINLKIRMAKSVKELNYLVGFLLDAMNAYAAQWKVDNVSDASVKIGVEPDPMVILKNIKDFAEKGSTKFENLGELAEGDLLMDETKRLNLLLKMNLNA